MTADDLRKDLQSFIQKNFLFDDKKTVGEDQSLLGSGIVDSTGILDLIGHLEETFQMKFADSELVADNFDSIGRILRFMDPKMSKPRV
jgi:acyl carrier protein